MELEQSPWVDPMVKGGATTPTRSAAKSRRVLARFIDACQKYVSSPSTRRFPVNKNTDQVRTQLPAPNLQRGALSNLRGDGRRAESQEPAGKNPSRKLMSRVVSNGWNSFPERCETVPTLRLLSSEKTSGVFAPFFGTNLPFNHIWP